MGMIQNLLKGMSQDKREFKEKFREAEMQMKIHKTLEDRQKSSNERELEVRMKRLREDDIKAKLERLRKKDVKELWSSKNKVLDKGTSMLKDDRPILKQKNIFKVTKKGKSKNKGSIIR